MTVVLANPPRRVFSANSDVLPAVSVAVAVMEVPAARPLAVIEPLNLPSPAAVMKPRYLIP